MEAKIDNTNVFKEWTDYLLRGIPAASLVIVLAGNIYVYHYYNDFNINIYEFINPQEILSLFLPTIFEIVWIILASILIVFSIFIFHNRPKASETEAAKVSDKASSVDGLYLVPIIGLYYLVSAGMDLLVDGTLIKNETTLLVMKFIRFVLIDIIFPLAFVYWLYKQLRNKSVRLSRLFLFLIIAIQTYVFIKVAASFSSYSIRSEKQQNKTYIFGIGESALATSDSLKFIGSTNSYIFFYTNDKNDYKTLVYRRESLTKVIEITFQPRMQFWNIKRRR